jgi:hypothetical protein
VSLEVAIILRCLECETYWLPADEERWRAYLTDDEPEGFQNLGSRCGAVFVDEAAEEVVAFDRPGA